MRVQPDFCRPLVVLAALIIAGLMTVNACKRNTNPKDNRATPSSDFANETHSAQGNPKTSQGHDGSRASNGKKSLFALEAPLAYFGKLELPVVSENQAFPKADKKSVVLLVIDALNAKHLGIYGYKRETSPHIDSLARRGLVLTNYISNSSWTRPSFATLLTGVPKKTHQVELSSRILDAKFETLAEKFRKAGFETGGFVGNPLVRQIWGFGQGFRVYEDTHSFARAFPPDKLLVDRAIEWLQKKKDRPFFLMLFLTAPHTPYRPPLAFRRFLKEEKEGPVIEYPFREYEKPLPLDAHRRIVAAYDDEIAYVDHQIGRLVSYLKETRKEGDFSMVVTADHGEVFGEHNCYQHTYHMWEPALRVPLVLVSDLLQVKGRIDDRPFTHVDLAPTVLDLAGIDYKEDDLPGKSIVRAQNDLYDGRERLIFSQYFAHGVQRQAIRKGNLKLIHHHKVDGSVLKNLNSLERSIPHADPNRLPSLATEGERYELYNLGVDPEEKNDIFRESSKSKSVLHLMHGLYQNIGDGKPAAPELSPELIGALKAAGYIKSENLDGTKNNTGENGNK